MKRSIAESLDRLLVMLESHKYDFEEPPAVCPVCENGWIYYPDEFDETGKLVKARAAKPCRSEIHKPEKVRTPEGARFS